MTYTDELDLLSPEHASAAAEMLRVMAHPDRLRIADLLLRDWHTVGAIAETLSLPPNAVSQHLTRMRAHGILAVQREGRSAYYDVIHPNCKNLLDCIRRHPPA